MPIVYTHMKPKTREIFYIGIGNDVKRAFRNEGRNSHWTRVFNKYGKIVDIISDDISLESAKKKAVYYNISRNSPILNGSGKGLDFSKHITIS